MSKPLKILFVEDVPTDAELEVRELKRAGLRVAHRLVETEQAFREALREFRPELIISDFSMPHFDGMGALALARELVPDVPFIFVSGTIGEEYAIRALKNGATDYVLKNNLVRLPAAVERALEDVEARTARKRAEREVAEQREFYRNVIDLDRNFIFAKDREGRFTLVNKALAEAYGCSVENLLGKTDADFNPKREEVEHFRKLDLDVMDTLREAFIPEERITDAAGRVRWLQTVKRPLVSADGKADMVLGVATDITERKRNEEALRDSEHRLDLALEASDLATWDWNIATGEVRFSRHWRDILGYELDEVPLHIEAWEKLTHPDDLVRVKSALAAHFKGSVPLLEVEYRMRSKSGEWRWIRTLGRVVERDAVGRALRKTGTHGDITERKNQEQKIARLSRIHAVLSGINSAIVRIRDREELFQEACRIAVEHGGFRMAYIGLLDRDTKSIKPMAWSGFEDGYLKDLKLSADPESADSGILALALLYKKPVTRDDIATDLRMRARDRALACGYRSQVVLPLVVTEQSIGALVLYAGEIGIFDEEEMKLLEELAGDISFALDHIAKSEQLDYLAYFNAITGLPNRALFNDRLEQRVGAARRDQKAFAVMMLDIERFRNINETLGRKAGDDLLRQVAQRLKNAFDETDIVAHIGGNQFAIATRRVDAGADVAHILEKILASVLGQPFTVGGSELRLAFRAGVAVYPADGADVDSLFRNAEAALNGAKRSGHKYVFYAPQMNARVAETLKLENQLRVAVLEEQFVLHYQPRVELASGRVNGLEALIRWQSPELGLVAPGAFIPILEETGMILEVGRWALKQAAADYASWLAKGLQPPRIAVNVSAIQLRQQNFVQQVKAAIAAGDGRSDAIDIEITESMLMEDIEGNIHKLAAIRESGMEVALDDFGTGYSSLSYLAKLPIDALKVDRSFITQMTTSPEDMAIVSTVIALGHSLNLKVVAEGVETEEQRNLLRLLKCDEMQGYLFSPPLPAEEAAALFGAKNVG